MNPAPVCLVFLLAACASDSKPTDALLGDWQILDSDTVCVTQLSLAEPDYSFGYLCAFAEGGDYGLDQEVGEYTASNGQITLRPTSETCPTTTLDPTVLNYALLDKDTLRVRGLRGSQWAMRWPEGAEGA